MAKHRKREKYNSEQQRYGPVYNNPFGINPQQLISMLGGNMNGIGNILSSMNRNGFDFASNLARPFSIDNSRIRANFGTHSTFHTFGFINVSNMVFIKG